MAEFSIRDKCFINTNRDADTFVGLICNEGEFSVHFPLGFKVSEDEKELRKDILMLLSTIGLTIGHKKSRIQENGENCDQIGFPLQAYIKVIYDYYERGYYRERDVEDIVSTKGRINWSKTIKSQKPVIQDENVYYLEFVTRKNTLNENEQITLIHEYCVYESFVKVGWLFTSVLPNIPRIKRNDKQFLAVLKGKLSRTFNDRNKHLFKAMIQIVENQQDENAPIQFKYGTYRFEYVWEALVDKVYGIEGKNAYFPKTTWRINGKRHDNASLVPDSIMLYENDIYVLDAKYYKFGTTHSLTDLPESASINKQITYGEYIANNKANGGKVYNAFIIPFDSEDSYWNTSKVFAIGEATGNWRNNIEIYEHVQGIMIDVRYLMRISVSRDSNAIMKLASCIVNAIEGDL